MGLAEEAASAAAQRKQRDAAAPPIHGREAALALARRHSAAVQKSFKEAADVLAEQQIPAAVGFTAKRGFWTGTMTPRFGSRVWSVAGYLLEASGEVMASWQQNPRGGLAPVNMFPNASWSRGFSRWDKGTLFIDLKGAAHVNFGLLGAANDHCHFIKARDEPIWHVCPAQTDRIILGRPEGPLLGISSGGWDDTTLTTRDLLEAIHYSVIGLVSNGGEAG